MALGQGEPVSLAQRPWYEARTRHFTAYSCGPTQEVAELEARLEQLHDAVPIQAGGHPVASPPVVVIVFPDRESMQPFLPLYQGQPANLAAFFKPGSDENLIVVHLSADGAGELASIFHEYSHFLLRQNERIWPAWLKEGMAEIYSTFEVTSANTARIGKPMEAHLRLLASVPLMPLSQLLAVTRDSPEYNERDRQGIFYAESWLLTHFLIFGENGTYKARLATLTALLRQGQPPVAAFTNAFRTPLATIEAQLRGYLEYGPQASLAFPVNNVLRAARALTSRRLAPVEVRFRLGDELLRIGRLEAAETQFEEARGMSPDSPEPYEGLGLLAAKQGRPEEAVRCLEEAFQRNSKSYLAHYLYARERLRLEAGEAHSYTRLEAALARTLQHHLDQSVALMPDFGPARYLLGFLDLVQGEDLPAAEQQLEKAVELEPNQEAYLLLLAQAQLRSGSREAARRTLESLRLPYVDGEVRRDAEEMLREMGNP